MSLRGRQTSETETKRGCALDGETIDAVVVTRRRRCRETVDDFVEELEDMRLEVVVVDQSDQEIRVVDLHYNSNNNNSSSSRIDRV